MNYERRNCPPGGIKFNRRKYRAGQFIPGTVMFQHVDPRYARAAAHIDGVQTEYAEPVPEGWGEPAPADESFDPSQREYNALLAAVHANPLDSTGHFALSDWHAERGEQDEADFRKAMGEWVGRYKHPSSPYQPQMAVESVGERPWISGMGERPLPRGVGAGFEYPDNFVWENLPEVAHVDLSSIPDHVGVRRWGTGFIHWPSYPAMEDSFRRAFMAGRERQRTQPPEQFSAYGPQDETGTFIEPQGRFGDRQDVWGENADTLTWDDPNKKLKTPDAQDEFGKPAALPDFNDPNFKTPVITPPQQPTQTVANPKDSDDFKMGIASHIAGLPESELMGMFKNFNLDPYAPDAMNDLLKAAMSFLKKDELANPQGASQQPPSSQTSKSVQTTSGTPVERHELFSHPVRHGMEHGEIANMIPIASSGRVESGGANETWLTTFADGSEGVFKPEYGEYPGLRPGIDAGTYYNREVAGSLVADLLGFDDLVPKTTFREHYGKKGSVQEFIPNTKTAKRVDESLMHDGNEDLARAAVFDYITGNADRHHGNWLLDQNGKLVLIDNGLSFPYGYSPKTYGNLVQQKSREVQQDWGVPQRRLSSNLEMLREASLRGLPLPDMTGMAEKWPEVEQVLRDSGVDDEAIRKTKQRFAYVTSGRYGRIRDLPAYWSGSDEHFLPPLRTYF